MNHSLTDQILEKEVHGLWIGTKLSAVELLTLHSFVKNGYRFNLWIYEPLETKIPAEVTVRDASEIIPREKIFFYRHSSQFGIGKGSVAGFSDIFRYKLLHDVGGWWVDMDVTSLKPFDVTSAYFFRQHHDLPLVGNVMKAPKGSLLMLECYEEAIRSVDENNQDWHKPIDILVKAVERHGLEDCIYRDVSNSDEWHKIRPFLTREIVFPDQWRFIHWCNEAWRNDFLSKSDIMYQSSLGNLLQEYGLLPRFSEREQSRHDRKIARKIFWQRVKQFVGKYLKV